MNESISKKNKWYSNVIHNPVFYLATIAIGLAIFNMTTHWTLVCGLQSIGLISGVNC